MKQLSNYQKLALAGIILTSFALHLVRIDYPPEPVFDEVHFATYGANYANRIATFDIHPPLGKAILGGLIKLYPEERYKDAKFIDLVLDEDSGGISGVAREEKFNEFPYVPLRVLISIFGSLIPLLVFELGRRITGNVNGSLLAAFFITFENALLSFTRLILLEGIYIFLGLLALVIFFGKRQRMLLSSIVWGAAISIKLTAITFLGPIFIPIFIGSKGIGKNLKRANKFVIFLLVGTTIFVMVHIGINAFLFEPEDRLSVYASVMTDSDYTKSLQNPLELEKLSYLEKIAKASTLDFLTMVGGYTYGVRNHVDESRWFMWPVMQKTISMFYGDSKGSGSILLIGNPFVWIISTASILLSPLLFLRFRKKRKPTKAITLLVGGYIFALLPFITFVKRITFLYHYFPALIFATMLAGYMISKYIEDESPRFRKYTYVSIVTLTIAGFIYVARFTYGF